MNINGYITEPAKKIPVTAEADICVIGGSATGVFAAVRAARLGAKVILVERAIASAERQQTVLSMYGTHFLIPTIKTNHSRSHRRTS